MEEKDKISKEDLDNQQKAKQSELSIKQVLNDQLKALKEIAGAKAESVDLSKQVLKFHREVDGYIGEEFDKTKEIVRENDAINKNLKHTARLEKEVRDEVSRLNELAQEGDELAGEEAQNLREKLETLGKIRAGLVEEGITRDQVNEKMGIFDNIIRGIKDIPFIGELGLADDLLKDMQLAAQNGKNVFVEGFKSIKSAFLEAIGPLIFAATIKSIMEISNQLRDIGRNLGLSKIEAGKFRVELGVAAATAGDILATSENLIEANQQLNQIRGTGVKFTTQQLLDTNRLLKAEVLTVEAAGELSRLASVTGQGIREAYLNQIEGVLAAEKESGVRLDIKTTLEATNKVSGQIRAQLGANPALIAESVAQAKALGMELEDVASAGRALLDFESSITNELEAELLIGKQLNLERARAAALTGDYQTLTEEINKNVGDFYEFSKLNVLQQDALAKSVGMSTDALSDQLLQKADLNKLAQQARDEGRDDIAKNLEQLSVGDKLNANMDRLKSIFGDILGIVTPIVEIFGTMVQFISESTAAIVILSGALGAMAAKQAYSAVLSMGKAVADIFSGNAKFGLPGVAMSIGAVGAMMAAISAVKSVKLAEGGIIEPTPGGTLATIGEAGEAEAVIPLSKLEQLGFNNKMTPPPQLEMNNKGINKDDLVSALRTVENEKSKQNLIIREKDSNYADANPMNNQGDSYQVKYETSFS
tara:strand:+ start:1242 stop:3362 length:2121 start_codon:yes stop_codon:yes gene_type:complete